MPGGYTGGATPDPIPNSEVKPSEADGSSTARYCESRKPPGYFFPPSIPRFYCNRGLRPTPSHRIGLRTSSTRRLPILRLGSHFAVSSRTEGWMGESWGDVTVSSRNGEPKGKSGVRLQLASLPGATMDAGMGANLTSQPGNNMAVRKDRRFYWETK